MSLVEQPAAAPAPLPARPLRTGRGAKPHVPSACTNCKKAHLACDLQRPCQRCVNSNKCTTCKDVQHKKRGRPRSKDKQPADAPRRGSVETQGRSPMETLMSQFSFAVPPGTPRCTTPDPVASVVSVAPAAHSTDSAYLFLTPELLCLRLDEPADTMVLGHSLLSLINRRLADFVSPHDLPHVLGTFTSLRRQLAAHLAPPARYPYCSLAPVCAVDPNTFQRQPLARLLRPACPQVSAKLRAHLRTAAGDHRLFDLEVFVGAVGAAGSLDEAYFVCRVARFDALGALPRAPEPPAGKRRRVGGDALYMLAEATDVSAGASCNSTSASSPVLSPGASLASSLSPPLTPLGHTVLPSLADMLRSLDAKPAPLRFSPPAFTSPGH